jgi:hypothetical protein
MPMAKGLADTRCRHVRAKSAIDRSARELFEPKRGFAAENGAEYPGSTTDTVLSVEEQMRREWDPSEGGLPIFLL